MSDRQIVHIIDDDAPVRDSLGLLLTTEGYRVQTYASAHSFLHAIGAHETGCVITDVCMPEMNGNELLARMKERRLNLPVIVITAHTNVSLAVQAMNQGAVDLLEKPFDDDAIISSIRQAFTHTNDGKRDTEQAQNILTKLATLTGMENEVLAGLLKGQPNKIIAHELGVSIRIIEVHRANVMAKMQAGSLSELMRMSLIAADIKTN